jgi:hypothetical protein
MLHEHCLTKQGTSLLASSRFSSPAPAAAGVNVEGWSNPSEATTALVDRYSSCVITLNGICLRVTLKYIGPRAKIRLFMEFVGQDIGFHVAKKNMFQGLGEEARASNI